MSQRAIMMLSLLMTMVAAPHWIVMGIAGERLNSSKGVGVLEATLRYLWKAVMAAQMFWHATTVLVQYSITVHVLSSLIVTVIVVAVQCTLNNAVVSVETLE